MSLALLCAVPSARAQDTAVVLLQTNLPDAELFADTTRIGPASRGVFVLPATVRMLRLVPPGGDAWAVAPVTTALSAAPGDTIAVDLPFPYHYKVESVPFGASVYQSNVAGRREIGETPVLYKSPRPLEGMLVVEREGYLPLEIEPGNQVWNRYVVTLQPLTPTPAEDAEITWKPPGRPRRWIDYTAAAVAVGAGVLAVHYKFKADRLDDRYRSTGSEALRDRVHAFDVRSAVALGVMQAGIGVLAVRFVLR